VDGITEQLTYFTRCENFPQAVSGIKAASPECIHLILPEFPDLLKTAGLLREVKHSTVHHIRTTSGHPVNSRPGRLDPARLKIAQAEFNAMIDNGTTRRPESPWSSALHMVPKNDFGWRPCGDYRALNARTISDRYPVQHIADFSHNLAGCKIFSKIDLVKAYNQIPVSSENVPNTAITLRLFL
jgi:hypothetical protein